VKYPFGLKVEFDTAYLVRSRFISDTNILLSAREYSTQKSRLLKISI
jgi:hypothetical protein